MKAGKKYEQNGVQCAMYPNPVMNITQSINGSYSHQGTNAIDDAQATTGISNGYAPCDVRCVATDYVNGNFILWESVNPVKTARHGVQHIHFYVGHDNTADAYVGLVVRQGQQLFSEGTAGQATGNHNHIEVALGKWSGKFYVLNSRGVYMLPNNVNPANVFFSDDTQIINSGGLSWLGMGSSGSSIPSSGTFRFTHDNIRIRYGTNGLAGEYTGTDYMAGNTVRYDSTYEKDGYLWISWIGASSGRRVSCAIRNPQGQMWGTVI